MGGELTSLSDRDRDRQTETDRDRQRQRQTVYLVMDHLLMLLLLLWSSGLQAEDKQQSTGFQCGSTAKVDIMLLVHESNSIRPEDHRTITSFLSQIVSKFDIGPDKVRIGLVQGNHLSTITWSLKTHQTKQSLLEAIDNLHETGGGIYSGYALRVILQDQFKPSAGMRKDSQRIAVLIGDGNYRQDSHLSSAHMDDINLEFYAVGVKTRETQLKEIASDPDETHMYNVSDFSSLLDIVDNLTINLCNSANRSESVRLVGGDSRCAGTLEVKKKEWRPVDLYGSTLKKADAICGELDCGPAVSIGSRKESSDRSVWWINYQCVENGYALRDCASDAASSPIMELTCSE